MIKRRTPLKRTALAPPNAEQIQAWQNRKRTPIGRNARTRKLGRRARREEAALAHGRALAIARSGGWCEGPYLPAVHLATPHRACHVHHVLPRGRGGKHGLDNLLHTCEELHNFIHQNPAWAEEAGLLRASGVQGVEVENVWPW